MPTPRRATKEVAASKREDGKPRRSRGRPKLEDVAEIESRLLATALAEFLRLGYGATSMRQIVKAAGISKTTLYSRFSSKEQLFRAIMREQLDRISIAAALSQGGGQLDLEKGLKGYANYMLKMSFESGLLGVNRLIYSESRRFPELAALAQERTEVGIKQVADFIRQCAEADGVACKDPEGIAEAFIFMLRGWYASVMLIGRKASVAERERWVERTVRAFLLAPRDW